MSKDLETIRTLSRAIAGATETAYALAPRDGQLDAGSITRVFGAPVGIDDAAWPRHSRGAPMVHLVSLDFAEVPSLARPGFRAVSVFVDDPDVNDCLYEPIPNNAKIVYLTEAAVASGVTATLATRPAQPIAIEPLTVPSAVLAGDGSGFDDATLDELHNELFGLAGLVARQPIWSAAGKGHHGNFLLQFSELLVPINLGDGGTMYVFDDVAFFQGF